MKVNQRGTATLLGIAAMAIVLLIVITGLVLVNLSGKLIAKQLLYKGQAYNAAEAGIVNALSWFRKQTTQPVKDDGGSPNDPTDCLGFDPQNDPLASPPINETNNTGLGIERDFSVSPLGNVRGRYLVMREDLDCDGTIDTGRDGLGVVDRSEERGKDSPGRVWQVESIGVIYVDADNGTTDPALGDMDWPDTNGNGRPDAGEGEILVTQTLRSDIQRLTSSFPAQAAVIGEGVTTVTSLARVRGGAGLGAGTGILYVGTGNPVIGGAPTEVSGSPATSQDLAPFEGSIPEVFGVTEQELRNMADLIGTLAEISAILQPGESLPAMNLIVVEGNGGTVSFDATRPLIGSGILVVLDGDVVIGANTNANFNGIIYVRGTYTQNAPSLISGTVMVVKKSDGTGGTSNITGSGDFSEIDYDGAMIQQVQNQLGQYRFSRAPYLVSLN